MVNGTKLTPGRLRPFRRQIFCPGTQERMPLPGKATSPVSRVPAAHSSSSAIPRETGRYRGILPFLRHLPPAFLSARVRDWRDERDEKGMLNCSSRISRPTRSSHLLLWFSAARCVDTLAAGFHSTFPCPCRPRIRVSPRYKMTSQDCRKTLSGISRPRYPCTYLAWISFTAFSTCVM